MDIVKELEDGARSLATAKYLMVMAITLTLYDYLLMLDHEIRYMWKGRKTFVFYFYVLNRILLTALRLWDIHVSSGPKNSEAGCRTTYYAEFLISTFLLSSSDVFIGLRMYAITAANKFLAVYFGALALSKLVVNLAAFLRPVGLLELPPIPLDIFKTCAFIPHSRSFRLVPNAIATAFDLSAFLVVAWCAYYSIGTLKLSAVIRTIVAQGTIYFLAMVALQIYIQISLSLTHGVSQQYSLEAYSFINPVLTMRFALSLKRSADSGQEWQSTGVSSIKYRGGTPSGSRALDVRDGIEMGSVISPNETSQACGH